MSSLVTQDTSSIARPLNFDSLGSSSHERAVYGSHKDIYQDVSIVKQLTKAKFPVYLINSQVTKLNYAMKVFPHHNGQPQAFYKNEIRYSGLRHPNVIKSLYFDQKREAIIDGSSQQISYIIMDYAPHGDLFKFLKEKPGVFDEKLARTYFKQLIEGLEYLHKNGVAHMDLKLDNLMISSDYTLKISELDMAHYEKDIMPIGNGSKYFRAPEMVISKCTNPKATDIYSAGVILFALLARGILPQFEAELIDGINLAELLANDINKFWTFHSRVQKSRRNQFDKDFKDLFEAMTKLNPNERASIETIKASNWYNKPTYTLDELKVVMERNFSC